MKIVNHRLCKNNGEPFPYIESPNRGQVITPKILVMHYTAGSTAKGTIETFQQKDRRVSAHLVIARDGDITQMVPFNRLAMHAGPSQYRHLKSLNQHSIGVELDNAGELEIKGEAWCSWFGKSYGKVSANPEDASGENEVMVAAHPYDGRVRGWHTYTEKQLEAATRVACAIFVHYQLTGVVGHEDIAPGRKIDPGPAFPKASFRRAVLGREADEPELLVTAASLNVREGPGTAYDKRSASPLPKGTTLRLLSEEGVWGYVEVLDSERVPHNTGWVHLNYTAPAQEV